MAPVSLLMPAGDEDAACSVILSGDTTGCAEQISFSADLPVAIQKARSCVTVMFNNKYGRAYRHDVINSSSAHRGVESGLGETWFDQWSRDRNDT
ncbi:MAG: hypothetical protein ACR2RE_28065 [Geminicoccaceae bacterium]